ncbi:transposase [Saccharopolyspora gloriosae]|uniref:transposase n=1 Tax=Saccharopolyspora gloriosae TaxID=455344 RepID=UPI0037C50E23
MPRPHHEIQTRNRLDQQTEDWQRRYAIRAGIVATLSQNVRVHGLRRPRYRGMAKTHVQHVFTGMAYNVTRVADRISDPATGPPPNHLLSGPLHHPRRRAEGRKDHQESHGIGPRTLRP